MRGSSIFLALLWLIISGVNVAAHKLPLAGLDLAIFAIYLSLAIRDPKSPKDKHHNASKQ